MNLERENSDICINFIIKLWRQDDDDRIIDIVEQILRHDIIDPFKLISRHSEYRLTLERFLQIKKYYNIRGINENYIPWGNAYFDVLIELVDEKTTKLSDMLEHYLKGSGCKDMAEKYLRNLENAKKRDHFHPGIKSPNKNFHDFYNTWRDGKGDEYCHLFTGEKELWLNFYNYNKYKNFL